MTFKKILLFGGSGMLGRELSRSFLGKSYEIIAPPRDKADISNQKAVYDVIREIKPDIILNAAVLVNVDACEENPGTAYAVNTLGPLFIADTLRLLDLKTTFIQFGSSDIFGSNFDASPSEEEKGFSPVNVYGRSKYYGEKCLDGILDGKEFGIYIVRASWIFSEFKKTFVDVIAEQVKHPKGILEIADDQKGIPTWGKEIATNTRKLVEEQYPYGTYHFVPEMNGESVTRFAIAEKIARFFGQENTSRLFSPASRKNIFKTQRPASSAIVNTKFPKFPHWEYSLREYLREQYTQT